MSSLLDILHRKDSRTEPDSETTEFPANHAAETVELRLAVDNGPAEATSEISIAEEPAVTPSPATQRPPDPFATQLLTALQLRQRSRRNSAWLGAGLLFIVLAAGVATWLLNEVSFDQAASDSLFTATSPSASTPASAPIDEPLTVSPLRDAAEAPAAQEQPKLQGQKPQRPKREQTDTAWFDTPATEAPAGSSADAPVDTTDDYAAEPIRIVRGTTTNPLFPRLREAWVAFQAADYMRAETLYREVRAADPGNVDALLGLGALATRGGRTDEAREMYQAVLQAEPQNSSAISALSTLPAAGTRQLDESGLKNLLREQPGAASLHFALGLQYVAQGRWPDAQVAFFDAVSNDPTNADYAYNLAVSLDQLGQAGPAAAYYQRALNLATASALFNPGVAQARLNTLRPAASPAVVTQAAAAEATAP